MDGSDHPYGPVTVETYQWFVRNADRISDAYAIVICDEAHTALGEKTSACIRRWPEPVLHRHDRHRRADRPPRRRPLPHPDLALRPRPGRAPRRDRPASLHPHPARARGAHDRQGAAAPRRGGPGLRPGGAGQAAGPGALQRRGGRSLPIPLSADSRRRLHGRRAPRQKRRGLVPRRRDQRPRRVRRDPEARAGGDPRRVRARRGGRALQRDAARRGLELAAGDDLHAPRADRLAPRLSAAGRPGHPARAREGGRTGDRLRPSRHDQRRDDRDPAQPARSRRLPGRRDRRRPGAARPRSAGAGRAPGGARIGRPRAPPGRARARAVADRRREPQLLRAARLGGARRIAG